MPRTTSPPLLRLTVGLGLSAALLTAALRAESAHIEASPASLPAVTIAEEVPAPSEGQTQWWQVWRWI
jgi:hypothetical protein